MNSFPSLYSKFIKASTAVALTTFYSFSSYAMDNDDWYLIGSSHITTSKKHTALEFTAKDLNTITTKRKNNLQTIATSSRTEKPAAETQEFPVTPGEKISVTFKAGIEGCIRYRVWAGGNYIDLVTLTGNDSNMLQNIEGK